MGVICSRLSSCRQCVLHHFIGEEGGVNGGGKGVGGVTDLEGYNLPEMDQISRRSSPC